MKDLLKFEFFKLRRAKSIYVCTFIMLALVFLSAVLTDLMLEEAPELSTFMLMTEPTGASMLLSAVNDSSFTLIIGIFVIIFVSEDYDVGTVNNVYARGYSRLRVYFSKTLSVLVAASAMFLAVTLLSFLFGSAYFKMGDIGGREIGILAIQYVSSMTFVAAAFAIASVFRKNGTSIALFIFLPMIAEIVLSILDVIFGFENFSFTELWFSSFILDASVSQEPERLVVCTLGSLVYIAGFIAIGAFLNARSKR